MGIVPCKSTTTDKQIISGTLPEQDLSLSRTDDKSIESDEKDSLGAGEAAGTAAYSAGDVRSVLTSQQPHVTVTESLQQASDMQGQDERIVRTIHKTDSITIVKELVIDSPPLGRSFDDSVDDTSELSVRPPSSSVSIANGSDSGNDTPEPTTLSRTPSGLLTPPSIDSAYGIKRGPSPPPVVYVTPSALTRQDMERRRLQAQEGQTYIQERFLHVNGPTLVPDSHFGKARRLIRKEHQMEIKVPAELLQDVDLQENSDVSDVTEQCQLLNSNNVNNLYSDKDRDNNNEENVNGSEDIEENVDNQKNINDMDNEMDNLSENSSQLSKENHDSNNAASEDEFPEMKVRFVDHIDNEGEGFIMRKTPFKSPVALSDEETYTESDNDSADDERKSVENVRLIEELDVQTKRSKGTESLEEDRLDKADKDDIFEGTNSQGNMCVEKSDGKTSSQSSHSKSSNHSISANEVESDTEIGLLDSSTDHRTENIAGIGDSDADSDHDTDDDADQKDDGEGANEEGHGANNADHHENEAGRSSKDEDSDASEDSEDENHRKSDASEDSEDENHRKSDASEDSEDEKHDEIRAEDIPSDVSLDKQLHNHPSSDPVFINTTHTQSEPVMNSVQMSSTTSKVTAPVSSEFTPKPKVLEKRHNVSQIPKYSPQNRPVLKVTGYMGEGSAERGRRMQANHVSPFYTEERLQLSPSVRYLSRSPAMASRKGHVPIHLQSNAYVEDGKLCITLRGPSRALPDLNKPNSMISREISVPMDVKITYVRDERRTNHNLHLPSVYAPKKPHRQYSPVNRNIIETRAARAPFNTRMEPKPHNHLKPKQGRSPASSERSSTYSVNRKPFK